MSKDSHTVHIQIYRWAGQWGPFTVRIPCGECTLTGDIIKDICNKELKDIPVDVNTKDWLSYWWEPLPKGGWHAPVILVDGKLVSQGKAINRGVLAEAVTQAYIGKSNIIGTHVFGKDNCKHCVRAKNMMDQNHLSYKYHNVIESSVHLYEMIARTKQKIGHKTPVTTPQIWIDGEYIGGADALEEYLQRSAKQIAA